MNPLTYPDSDRPFAFEDLPLNDDGKRLEPESWGPIYSKPTKPTHLREYDPPTNAPSGQKTAHVDDAKLRAKIKAEFVAATNADRRAWANGLPRKGAYGKAETIVEAYEQAMTAKRARERVQAGYLSPRDAFRETPRKPHYVLRAGAWQLAA